MFNVGKKWILSWFVALFFFFSGFEFFFNVWNVCLKFADFLFSWFFGYFRVVERISEFLDSISVWRKLAFWWCWWFNCGDLFLEWKDFVSDLWFFFLYFYGLFYFFSLFFCCWWCDDIDDLLALSLKNHGFFSFVFVVAAEDAFVGFTNDLFAKFKCFLFADVFFGKTFKHSLKLLDAFCIFLNY